MPRYEPFHRLIAHGEWADALVLDALERLPAPPIVALREFAHVLGAQEVWLARIEGRVPRTPVWPDLPLAGLAPLAAANRAGYRALLDRLTDADLARPVSYTNSAGDSFSTLLGDIMLHVAMHGQYHRGKVNVALRQAGLPPVPVDLVAFVRGSPAAVTTPPAP